MQGFSQKQIQTAWDELDKTILSIISRRATPGGLRIEDLFMSVPYSALKQLIIWDTEEREFEVISQSVDRLVISGAIVIVNKNSPLKEMYFELSPSVLQSS